MALGADEDSSSDTPLSAMDPEALNRLSLDELVKRAGPLPQDRMLRRTVRRIDEAGREWVTVTFERNRISIKNAWLRSVFGLDLIGLSQRKG